MKKYPFFKHFMITILYLILMYLVMSFIKFDLFNPIKWLKNINEEQRGICLLCSLFAQIIIVACAKN